MWVFVFIPGLLFAVSGLYVGIQTLIENHFRDKPYIGHLNCRRDYLHRC